MATKSTVVVATTSAADDQRPLPDRVFTLEELKQCDGSGEDGTILVGLNGIVYDVTAGKNFYGAGGPYEVFAGRDATIGLATFNMAKMKKETSGELNLSEKHQRNVAHWEKLFKEKYKIVGTFTRPPLSPPPKDEPTEAGPPAKTKETKAQVTIADPPEEITKKSSTFCGLL